MAYTGLQENHYPNPISLPFVQQNLNYLLQCHPFMTNMDFMLRMKYGGIHGYEWWCLYLRMVNIYRLPNKRDNSHVWKMWP